MALNRTFVVHVEEASQVAEARRTAASLAERLEFSPGRVGQVALVATELATNLVRHAKRGELLLRASDAGNGASPDAVEMLSVDRGPGITDVDRSRRDGYSTAGTGGVGLGAVERQSDLFELYSQPSGTLAIARLGREGVHPSAARQRVELGAVLVAKPGESVPGDGWSWRLREDRLTVLLADGLGHGLHAHEAARAAVDRFESLHDDAPARVVEDIHAALRATRGAAVAMLAADLDRGVIRYCGLGNIMAHVVGSGGRRHTMVSQPGTAGHHASRIQEFSYPLPADGAIVMHSDGVSSGWDVGAYPGLRLRHPSLLCAAIYRDYSRGRDDLTVLNVARRDLVRLS